MPHVPSLPFLLGDFLVDACGLINIEGVGLRRGDSYSVPRRIYYGTWKALAAGNRVEGLTNAWEVGAMMNLGKISLLLITPSLPKGEGPSPDT